MFNRFLLLVTVAFVAALIPLPAANATPIEQRDSTDPEGLVSILLLGADAGPERSGVRTDSIMVAQVDRESGRAALFSIPRNMVNVPLPQPYAPLFDCACWGSLLNELYGYANANPDLFGGGDNPGAIVMKETIGALLGIEIDYFALVDLPGFVDVFDALGGVTIDVPVRIQLYVSPPKEGEAWQQYDILPGRQHLDGRSALAYARSREDESDYERMARQRCLLGALANSVDIPSVLGSYPDLVDALGSSILTDIPLDELPDLVDVAAGIDLNSVATIGFTTANYMIGYVDPGYPVPNPAAIQAAVADAMTLPLESVVTSLGTISTACGWNSG